MKPRDLADHLDALLDPEGLRDYGPNGLQVEGTRDVRRVAVGVTACLAFLDAAAAWDADAMVVHHGLFWGGAGHTRLVGSLRSRVARVIEDDTSLFAYHLPLDRHPTLGNNAVLARELGAVGLTPAFELDGQAIGMRGQLPKPQPVGDVVARIAAVTQREPLVVAGGPEEVRTVGIVTGGGARLAETAPGLGIDLFVTGEASEQIVHFAREEGIHFVAAGHHATERFGVREVGRYLETELRLESRFFEIPNPV